MARRRCPEPPQSPICEFPCHLHPHPLLPFLLLQGELDTAAHGADEAAGRLALQWVPGGEMEGKGLTSGVKKVGEGRGGFLDAGERVLLLWLREGCAGAHSGGGWASVAVPQPRSPPCIPPLPAGLQNVHGRTHQGVRQAINHKLLQAQSRLGSDSGSRQGASRGRHRCGTRRAARTQEVKAAMAY